MSKPAPLSEAALQKTCTDILALDGWRPLRTDPCSDRFRGKGFGELGMADYLYLRYFNAADPRGPVRYTKARVYDPTTETLWIEWKRPRGKVAAHQREWHTAERARGGLTLIAGEDFPATVEGFMTWYRASGLCRKQLKVSGA